MDKEFQKGLLKGITAVSAIFALLLAGAILVSYVNPVSAAAVEQIIADFRLSPNLTFCGATNTYTVEVRTLPSSAPIRTLLIFNGTAYPGKYVNIPPHDSFACGPPPAGWTLFNLYPPFPICQYMANTDTDMIQVGGSLNFTFTARTTTQSNYNWSFEAYDNGGTDGLWQPINMSMTVDCTAPVTTKTFIGPLKEQDGVEWIDGVTQVNLSAADDVEHNSGVNRTYWRNTLVNDEYCRYTTICEEAQGAGNFNLYTGPFYKPEESCHLLEFYSVDNVGNVEETKTNCFFVDKTPPVVEKDVGRPSVDETNEEEVNNGWVMWSTSDKHSGTSAAKLYVYDGTQDWAGVDVPVDIALADINSL